MESSISPKIEARPKFAHILQLLACCASYETQTHVIWASFVAQSNVCIYARFGLENYECVIRKVCMSLSRNDDGSVWCLCVLEVV